VLLVVGEVVKFFGLGGLRWVRLWLVGVFGVAVVYAHGVVNQGVRCGFAGGWGAEIGGFPRLDGDVGWVRL
jgi:hypothetical protein